MQLKMQDIVGLSSFYEAVKDQKLPMKVAYRLAQLAKAADNELQFYREKLQAIVAEYGEIDENGQPVTTENGEGIKLKPGAENACYQAMKELQEVDIVMPDIYFTIEELDTIEMSATEIVTILPFIKE